MTNEGKQLLLIDLCARCPYGVVCVVAYEDRNVHIECKGRMLLTNVGISGLTFKTDWVGEPSIIACIEKVAPYLRPMSSITEEEEIELNKAIELELEALAEPEDGRTTTSAAPAAFEIDFYNKHHLDFRGMIPKGLALEAPKYMYKTE